MKKETQHRLLYSPSPTHVQPDAAGCTTIIPHLFLHPYSTLFLYNIKKHSITQVLHTSLGMILMIDSILVGLISTTPMINLFLEIKPKLV